MTTPSCPHCKLAMHEGFTIDRGHANAVNTPEWVEGAPEKSFWLGVKLKGRTRLAVKVFRCSRCGLLESYAPQG